MVANLEEVRNNGILDTKVVPGNYGTTVEKSKEVLLQNVDVLNLDDEVKP